MIRQSFADYIADPDANYSALKHMEDSPLHYQARLEFERKDTPALALGRLTHALVFEPETVSSEFAIWEEGNRVGSAYKAFEAANEGKTIFKPAEIATARTMAEAVRRHPLVKPYLDGGVFEATVKWTDPATGIACKMRADWLIPSRRILLDLKTARSVHPRMFGRACAQYGYHRQFAHYSAGCEFGLGWRPERVLVVAAENTNPHDIVVYEMPDDALSIGRQDVDKWLTMLAYCRKTNTWPGRFSEEQVLALPDWIAGELTIEGEE